MNEIIKKISSYNLFNYLLPGTIFAYSTSYVSDFNLVQSDILIAAFLYYFIGLVISRIGSLIIEPILRRSRFVIFSSYSDFVKTSKIDDKIDILSEANNTYRTIIALFFSLLALKVYNIIAGCLSISKDLTTIIVIVLIMVLFLFAYRKQTKYITKRIESNK